MTIAFLNSILAPFIFKNLNLIIKLYVYEDRKHTYRNLPALQSNSIKKRFFKKKRVQPLDISPLFLKAWQEGNHSRNMVEIGEKNVLKKISKRN